MSIEWVRDLILCISGVVMIGVLIFIAVLLNSLYCKTKSTLDSIETTSTTIQGISSYVGDNMIKPVTQITALAQGIRQSIDAISRLFNK